MISLVYIRNVFDVFFTEFWYINIINNFIHTRNVFEILICETSVFVFFWF